MTGPEDDHSNTRPISVAELLARNGTIGAPPVGGRRRRRRGDTDSISVAELTGEIPVVRDHDDAPATGPSATAVETAPEPETEPEPEAEAQPEPEPEAEPEPAAETPADIEGDVAAEPDGETTEPASEGDDDDAVADYEAHVERRDADDDLDFFAPPRRSKFAWRRSRAQAPVDAEKADAEKVDAGTIDAGTVDAETVDAEEMSPDPLEWADSEADEEDAADAAVDLAEPNDDDDREASRTFLGSPDNELFGGHDVAGDVARRGHPDSIDLDDDAAPAGAMSSFLRALWVVGQCVVAVAFGAGLFIAFDQLWKWNSIIALVLGVLVILGLVVGVRVVRKTEDIGSTLIAVAVGAMVTFGPLALMQAG
ncbi:hypothetical protein [Mycobacterium sp. E740]|uniref:hypothetical protein n=1 Tax=Mycobacterium sp. E740 TaxID=1834149 RepID=UPI0007FE8632|nr:hypothetical protein [Mycobacterium sp. E740]OBI74062.1 hypothetical protein A5663_06405 [Mycobacterium sp. E740]